MRCAYLRVSHIRVDIFAKSYADRSYSSTPFTASSKRRQVRFTPSEVFVVASAFVFLVLISSPFCISRPLLLRSIYIAARVVFRKGLRVSPSLRARIIRGRWAPQIVIPHIFFRPMGIRVGNTARIYGNCNAVDVDRIL